MPRTVEMVRTLRTFIIRVSESPPRVVVEDVRERRRAVAADVAGAGAQIDAWLAGAAKEPVGDRGDRAREDCVSPPP
jgi:hypothetical protein